MSAIDATSAGNPPLAATGKSKSGAEEADSGAFGRVFDSVGQKSSGSKSPPEKTDSTHRDKDNIEKSASSSGDDAPSSTSDMPAMDAGDISADLVRLLGGVGNIQATASKDGQPVGKEASTPLRRDMLLNFAIQADAETDPATKTARLTVIGQETHFAPVDVPKRNPVPEQTKAPQVSIDALLIGEKEFIKATNKGDTTPGPDTETDVLIVDSKLREGSHPGSLESSLTRGAVTRALSSDVRNDVASSLASKATMTSVNNIQVPVDTMGGALTGVVDQLISHARDLTAATGQSTSTNSAGSSHLVDQSGGPVRILRLQLQPEELGLVTARLRIVGGVLELRLTADRQQSVEILQRDQQGLIEVLRRSGYNAEIASIDFARSNIGQQASGQQQASNGSAQSFAQSSPNHNGASGFSGGSDRHAGEGQAQNRDTTKRQYADEQQTEGRNDGSGRRDPQAVYL